MTEFRPGGFQQLPNIVKNIIIINVLVFLLQNVVPGDFMDKWFALHYWQSSQFRIWQLITHLFMHGSIGHIFFNMFALWMFGRILEDIWGPKKFLIFYLICGVGAALCHLGVLTYEYYPMHSDFVNYMHNPSLQEFIAYVNKYRVPVNGQFVEAWSNVPDSSQFAARSVALLDSQFDEATIGASGAVFGLLFAFGYLFPDTLLYLYFAIPVKAKWFVAGYALLELFSGVRNSAGDNVAHFAHLGGMLFAFILLKIWKRRPRNNYY